MTWLSVVIAWLSERSMIRPNGSVRETPDPVLEAEVCRLERRFSIIEAHAEPRARQDDSNV